MTFLQNMVEMTFFKKCHFNMSFQPPFCTSACTPGSAVAASTRASQLASRALLMERRSQTLHQSLTGPPTTCVHSGSTSASPLSPNVSIALPQAPFNETTAPAAGAA